MIPHSMRVMDRQPIPPALALLVLLFVLGSGRANEPVVLQPAVPLEAGATPLDLGDHAIPCVADWDGDGLKDLLLGYRPADKIAVFINVGAHSQPAFHGYSHVQAEGRDIQWPSAGCGAPAPWVCDYDQDGLRDLLVGTGLEGQVYFYRNVGDSTQTLLAAGVPLTVATVALTVPARATPFVHDWDEDGLEDLLCGAGDGQVYWFRNVGTASAPVYAPGVILQAGGARLDLGDRSVIRVFDWDGDGRKDVVGSAGYNVSWYRNTNLNSAPILQQARAIQAPEAGTGLAAINTGYRMRLELMDWNDDGVVDLLIGRHDGLVDLYEGYRFAVISVARTPSNKVVLTWNSAPFLQYDVLSGESLAALGTAQVEALPSAGRITTWTNLLSFSAQFFRILVRP